jgi:hypothetical protein
MTDEEITQLAINTIRTLARNQRSRAVAAARAPEAS